MATTTPVPLTDLFAPADLLTALEVSLAALHIFRPVYGPDGVTIVDFSLCYLNPAAQRMTGLSERPGGTALTRFPHTVATGIFAYYQRVFQAEDTLSYEVNYQADGLDNYYRFQARRSGEWLVVSFTDTADQDRSAVELALRESQAREQEARAEVESQRNELRSFVEQAPVAVAIYRGPQYRVELANATTLAIWGRSLDEVLGRPVFEVLPESAVPEVVAHFDQVYATGQAHTVYEQATLLPRRGQPEEVYWNFVFQPDFDAEGKVSGIRSVGTDVSAQVRARQQVQRFNQELEARVVERTTQAQVARAEAERQRQQWEQLFLRAPAAICIFDGPEWVYEFVNPGYQAMFPGRALLGQRLVDALPEVADQPLMDILRHVYDTGNTFEGREVLVPLARTAEGPVEDIYFDLTYMARYNEQGQIDGFVTYAYDVTQQVLARHEREQQQQVLQRVFEQAPVAIFVLEGPEYLMKVVNPAMSEMLGRSAANLLGRPYFEVVPELAGQGYPELLAQVWRTGQAVVIEESPAHLARHQSDEVGYFTFVYQPVYDAQNQFSDIMCVTVDVTSQVVARQQVLALNAELNAANQQLTRTNVELDTFIYTASHDLKAPITNIEGILLALREHLPPAVQQDALVAQLLDMLQRTVTRFQGTITQLTDIGKLQLAHVGPAEPVAVAAVVADVLQDLSPAIRAAEASITVDVAADLLISFSPANLRSIVYNLLSNAVKYRSPNRPAQVNIRAEYTQQAVLLTVQDNGLGISERQQRQLFGLFQRLHTHVEGTGVGLYIVKRLVENAGGTIHVRSQPDAGARFSITFPQ